MMKRYFILLLMGLAFCNFLQAQTGLKAVYRSITHEPAAVDFFKKNPTVDHIVIRYENGKAEGLDLYTKGKLTTQGNPSIENYTMSFPGDVHILNNKYPQFRYENATSLRNRFSDKIAGINPSDSIYSLTATFRPDSVVYFFEFFATQREEVPMHLRPYLKDKIEVLESKLSKKLSSWNPSKADSMIVFEGLVSRDGLLKDLKILDGPQSYYSEELLKALISEANPWWPVLHASKRIEWPVKLSVQLSKDKKVTVSTL